MSEGRQILESPAFKKAFSDIEGALISKIKRVGVNDQETHKSLILSMQLLDKIKGQFETLLNDDKIKAHNDRAKKIL